MEFGIGSYFILNRSYGPLIHMCANAKNIKKNGSLINLHPHLNPQNAAATGEGLNLNLTKFQNRNKGNFGRGG